MGLKQRNWRKLANKDLVQEFARRVPNAYVMSARDVTLIKRLRENYALEPLDVMWGFMRFASTPSTRDIPTYCRWVARQVTIFSGESLAREGELAEWLTNTRMPMAAFIYYDLLDETFLGAAAGAAFSRSQAALQEYVDGILGAA